MGTGAALIGRTLAGRFRVTGFIGEGAMACVYRGVQDAEPHDVAIKVMHPHLLSDRTFVGRFRREAKAAAQIHHPNSVRILDTGVDGSLLYIAMELLAGQDLYEILSVERRLSEARTARILIEVCDALTAAHEEGIVHRDLKPENVMLTRDPDHPGKERVKVLDFGIAKILERDPGGDEDGPTSGSSFSVTALTHAGMVVGTPAYMSPEQCRGETIDARSDVYACGILAYQLVTGRLPFSGTTAMDFAVMHVRTPPTPPSEVVNGVTTQFERLLLKALSKWPALRQQSAAALKSELERLLPTLATTPHEGKRLSVGPLKLGSLGGARVPTPEPMTARRPDESPTSDALRTLPAMSRVDEDSSDDLAPDAAVTLRPPPPPALGEPNPADDDAETQLQLTEEEERGIAPVVDDAAVTPLPVDDEPATPMTRDVASTVLGMPAPARTARLDTPPAERSPADDESERPSTIPTLSAPPGPRSSLVPAVRDTAWVLFAAALFVGIGFGTALFFLIR